MEENLQPDIQKLNEKINKESAIIDLLLLEMDKVIIGQKKMSERLSKMNLFNPKNRMFYRLFHQGAKQVALDNAGRVLIPTAHAERIGLGQEVMLIAYNDRVEIWDKSKYFKMIEENITDFADLANEVMGDLDEPKE